MLSKIKDKLFNKKTMGINTCIFIMHILCVMGLTCNITFGMYYIKYMMTLKTSEMLFTFQKNKNMICSN